MTQYFNDLNQPIGFPIEDWQPVQRPSTEPMLGQHCRLEGLEPQKHAKSLYEHFCLDTEHQNWTYLPYGPFTTFAAFNAWLTQISLQDDPLFYTVIDARTEQVVGMASYLRINPEVGTIEVGHIHFSPAMQGTCLATETMYLMMSRVFDDLGYRRYEWKCDALNAPSNAAALRLGFTFEGIFRQLTMYKSRNRDTAWYAIIDSDWPDIKAEFKRWLDPANFDDKGRQKTKLNQISRQST